MESIQTSAVEEEKDSQSQPLANHKQKTHLRPPKKKRKKTEPTVDLAAEETPFEKYTKELNSDAGGSGSSSRTKRAIRQKEKDRNTCSLFIQTDPLIWKHISEQVLDAYYYA